MKPTVKEIYDRIKADMEFRLTGGVKIPKYSFYGILAIVFAGAIYLCYGLAERLLDQLFVTSANDEYLRSYHASLHGIIPKSAKQTTGVIRVNGTYQTVLLEGTAFQNADGVTYYTTEEVIMNVENYNHVNVVAEVFGKAGNTSDSTLTILETLPDIDSEAIVISGFNDGIDAEGTEQLRNRILFARRNPPGGGRASDYERWATETTGVFYAWTKPTYYGPGTVVVVVADADKEPVSSIILTDCDTYIQTKAPLGVVVTTVNVVPKTVNLEIGIYPNTASIRSNIDSLVADVFDYDSQPGKTINLSKLSTAIGNGGVMRHTIPEIISGGVDITGNDIEATSLEILKLGTINYVTI